MGVGGSSVVGGGRGLARPKWVGRVSSVLAEETPLSEGMATWRTSADCPDPVLERLGLAGKCEKNVADVGEKWVDEDVDGRDV